MLFDLSDFVVVRATGAGHREYLNRRLSQKVVDLADGQMRRATLLGATGLMEGDFELLADGATTYLISPPKDSPAAVEHLLSKFVFTEDATFQALSDSRLIWAADSSPDAPAPGTLQRTGSGSLLWRSSYVPGGTCLLAPAPAAAEATPAATGTRDELHRLRIEAGIPWWGIDCDEKTNPLDAHLQLAIHDNKGCYPGQEAIARIVNLGHPARQLVGLRFEAGGAPAGTALQQDGREVGRVTSYTDSPAFGPIALAMVGWNARAAGTILTTASGTVARVVSLPFA